VPTRPPRVTETLAQLGETGWLERLSASMRSQRNRAVVVGAGDDAAVIEIGGRLVLLTVDVLIEGTHFTWKTTTPAALGEKAITVSVSDIAAMGGRPTAVTVGLGAPPDFEARRLEAVFRALDRACRRWGAAFVGGDTVRSDRLVLSVSVVGEFDGPRERLPLRSRMRAGQRLYVTGTLGDSAAGLELLLRSGADRQSASKKAEDYPPEEAVRANLSALKKSSVSEILPRSAGGKRPAEAGTTNEKAARRRLIDRHMRPVPRLAEGQSLARALDDLAMIDLSDDLWKSVKLMAEASGVGVAIRTDRLPISPAARRFCRANRRCALDLAVFGGEDFELLFATAADPKNVARIFRDAGRATPVTAIGEVGGAGVRWLDRRSREVALSGRPFEHFGA
jgi:thiamine-monophosphate kinase